MRTRIIGTGSCLPETVVTNDDLSKIMDTSDEWISSRTGIRERRLVKNETTASMSIEAARRALEDAKVSAQDIDFSTSAEETFICQYEGNPMNIGFKSTFLIDILNNISSQEIVMELNDPSRAGVIVPVEQGENEDLLMLLMPMMLND